MRAPGKGPRTYISLYFNCVIVLMVFLGTVRMTTDWVPFKFSACAAPGSGAFRCFIFDSSLFAGITSLCLAVREIITLTGKVRARSLLLDTLRLASVNCIALSFLLVSCCIAPRSPEGFRAYYQESYILFNLFVPLLTCVDFFFLSDRESLPLARVFSAAAPALLYALFYCIPILRSSAGGSIPEGRDWYGLFGGSTACFSRRLPLIIGIIAGLTLLLSFLSKACIKGRQRKKPEKSEEYDYHDPSPDLAGSAETASQFYLTKVFRIICVITPVTGLCSGIVFTLLWLSGHYTSGFCSIFLFDCCCAAYPVFALFLYNTCIGKDGLILSSKVRLGKTVLSLLLFLQWNLISYLVPFRDFWAYSLLFILLTALFLDSKLVLINIIAHSFSMALSVWFKGDQLLPFPANTFVSAMVFRSTLIVLGFTIIYLIVRLVEYNLLPTIDQLSGYDVLTHALNRRLLSHYLCEAMEDYEQKGKEFSVVMFDLDDFKYVNDTYGHTCGDEVLAEFVRVISARIPAGDHVFRYGGEEFLVLFHCSSGPAAACCSDILERMKALSFRFASDYRQSATAGVACYEKGMNIKDLIIRADQRLYAGKQKGKSCVVAE